MELAIKENEKKAYLPVEKLIPEDLHNFLMITRQTDSLNLTCGTTRLIWKKDLNQELQSDSGGTKRIGQIPGRNLEKGYIWPSQLPQASPFFFVKKKDGRLWPCQDYQYLNDWMVKNTYSLPLILEIMDKLKEAKYFLKFDVRWGYNNVQIQSGDK
jgi:hypothetical protein